MPLTTMLMTSMSTHAAQVLAVQGPNPVLLTQVECCHSSSRKQLQSWAYGQMATVRLLSRDKHKAGCDGGHSCTHAGLVPYQHLV